MALLVTEADLRAVTQSPTEISAAVDAVEASVLASHHRGAGQVIFGDLALDDDAYVKVLGSSAPGAGMSLQTFPAQANPDFHGDSRVMLLFDAGGALTALLAGDELNALRTSVPAALGARHLAPRDAQVLGILGSGYQAVSHALTITAAVPGLKEVRVWSPTTVNRERFAREQTQLRGLPVHACSSAQDVVESADILTATGRTDAGAQAYAAEWVKPGALLISMTRSAPPGLDGVARVVVPTKRRPELVAFGFTGVSVPKPAADPGGSVELIDVIEGRASAREHRDQIVVWELANVYLWDLPIAGWAHAWAVRAGVGLSFALSAAPRGEDA
ncbi:MAG: hypothetical protein M3130_03535 [Actinomycetota bacterium]|nr:hypothetical protein [Actinomycetota bacterium]